jgi:hypothetical protein
VDTASLVDAQIVKIKLLSSENENILAEKHILVEQLSNQTQLIFQKDRNSERLADQEKQLKGSLDDMQLQQSQLVLAERNARRMIEIEIDNCIERICGFGTVTGDELVEGALDAAGVGHSLGAIKDQSTMILIGLMSKLSKMSVRMSFIPILWEHHASKQKWKRLQKWKQFSKSSCRTTHLYSIQATRTMRAIKLFCLAVWKNSLRINKRLYFKQQETERKISHFVFSSYKTICNVLSQARVTASRRNQAVLVSITRHFFVCWSMATTGALLIQRHFSVKARTKTVSKLVADSFTKWYLFTSRRKLFKKMCCTRSCILKVLPSLFTLTSNLPSHFQKSILSLWQCICCDNHKLETFSHALQGPACRKKQRYVMIALSEFVRHKRRQKHHITLFSNAANWQCKV